MPKISIIVPVYNSYNYLRTINESLTSQSYQDIEIIYVNDGSPDNSKELIEDYLKKDNRIRLINKENGGAADALNTGTKKATGKYLMYIDADDTLDLKACERAVEVMDKNNVDLVFWLYTKEYRSSNKSVKGPKFFPNERHFKAKLEMQHLRRRMMGLIGEELKNPIATDYFNAGWAKLYRSSIIKDNNVKWTDTQKVGSSDVLFNAQVMPYVTSAYYLPEYLLYYTKDNNTSLTKTYGWSLFHKMKNLHNELEKVIKSNYPGLEVYNRALGNRRALSLLNVTLSVSSMPFHPKSIENLRAFISDQKYQAALSSLKFKYLPLHYQVFFFLAQLKSTYLLLFMGKMMRHLR